jgi:uncharacterized protein (DUF305 family)
MKPSPYARLLIMTMLSYLSMYALMYAMVNSVENVYPNVNQLYMAGLMTAPMVLIELGLMRSMYENRRLNVAIAAASMAALALLWVLIRGQAAVGDKEFLKSMIPHHAGAILMCQKAPIRDAEIRDLCGQILESQQREIDQMTAKLRKLG